MNKLAYMFGCAAAVTMLAVVAPADARGIGGYGGNSVPSAGSACFTEDFGAVVQSSCTAATYWEMALPTDFASTYDPVVTVAPNYVGGLPTGISCNVVVEFQDGGVATKTGYVPVPSSCTTSQCQYQPGPVNLSAGQWMFMICLMSEHTSLISVQY
jgi:hypothetical protein